MDERPIRIPYAPPTFVQARAAIAAREQERERRASDPEWQRLLGAARREAAAAASLLCSEFGASRVRLFGSLARGDAEEGFDIDLAVEGVPEAVFFRAWAAASECVGRELDLVALERAPALLRERVEADGLDLP